MIIRGIKCNRLVGLTPPTHHNQTISAPFKIRTERIKGQEMNKLSVPEPVLREPGHMFVPEANMCGGFGRKQETKLQDTRCVFRNLEVARQAEFPLEIREMTSSASQPNSGSGDQVGNVRVER
jgi:hypothetical protein